MPLHCGDSGPIDWPNGMPLLLLGPAVEREQGGTGGFELLRELESTLTLPVPILARRLAHLHRARDVETPVPRSDHGGDKVGLLQQPSAVVSAPGDTLRTPTVQVDGVDAILEVQRSLE